MARGRRINDNAVKFRSVVLSISVLDYFCECYYFIDSCRRVGLKLKLEEGKEGPKEVTMILPNRGEGW